MVALARNEALRGRPPVDAASDPDALLMLRVHDDSASAFEELMRRYRAPLERLFVRKVGMVDGAEDFVQEVFLRVWRARKSYTVQSRFSTWLYMVARNALSNWVRLRARRREFVLDQTDSETHSHLPLEGLVPDRRQSPPRCVLHQELVDCVQRAVASMTPRQRRAVLLRLQDLSYDEMAERLCVSREAVRSLLARSRADLRRRLDPYLAFGGKPWTTSPTPVPASEVRVAGDSPVRRVLLLASAESDPVHSV